MKTLYRYDENGRYIGAIEAQKQRYSSDLEGRDIYFDYPNTTELAPPSVADDHMAVWNGSAWEDSYDYDKLRKRRADECFSVVDRSVLWYSGLTDSQREELSEWYQAWLKVTETLVIPEKPKWL